MKYFMLIFILLFSSPLLAQEVTVELEKPAINMNDVASIKRGAKFFATNCMVCHTMIYLRYDKIAQESGVLYSKMPIHVKTWPTAVKPPDLSLEASHRGVDWIYTYLHSFYKDPSRTTGFNNLILPNTAMPDIVAPYQGQQILAPASERGDLLYRRDYQWYDLIELQTPGSMSPEQFDATITDLVNFLAYASEPYKAEQHFLGWFVIGFLVILFIFVYLLKRAYWKDVENA